ncbi:hypothetical protein GCM10010521_35590 [Streptomyces rameus]|uniref:Uncharacterized protein n=1 Tax=Streptomyces rameus TaxID=68261 RepID=A0ABP6NJ64_9ACTN
MTGTQIPPREPGAALLAVGRFFRPGTPPPGLHGVTLTGGREADIRNDPGRRGRCQRARGKEA